MQTFLEKLQAACVSNQSLLCVGLDPDPERMAVADVVPVQPGHCGRHRRPGVRL